MPASTRLREALAKGETSLGMWQMLPGANISRILASSGIDWVLLDCEHGNIDDQTMHDAVPAIAALGVSPIVRVPDMQGWMVKRALDSGAHGILVPLLRTAEDARRLVRNTKFPPQGLRGFGSPIAPERFSLSLTGYLLEANSMLLTMAQIETQEALDNVDEIATVDGIDVLFVGPFDLGNNIGYPILDGIMVPQLKVAISNILVAAHNASKKAGIYCTGGEQAKQFTDLGFDMINVATDYSALQYALREQFCLARTEEKPNPLIELRHLLGEENVSTSKADRDGHSSSEWSSCDFNGDETPAFVVYPGSTEEVAGVMKICHTRRIPVTAYSGGTSLEGHFVPTRGGLCIDFNRMDQLIQLNAKDLDVIVQPAMGWEELNEILAEQGLYFPPDPGPGAKIGGMIGTGCSGTNAYRYGTMREWVLSLTVVLADGTIIKTRRRPMKSSAGYDLSKLLIGSEGTLGLVTEATLRITAKPRNVRVAVATFPSIYDAAECVSHIVGMGIQLEGIEILDDVQMRCINNSGSTSKKWKESPTLFFKFAGTLTGVQEQIGIVQKIAENTKSSTFAFARDEVESTELWSARKEALWSIMAMRRDERDHVWTTDVAVPVSRLPEIMQQTKDDISASGLLSGMVGHVGDGNFHAFLLFNDEEREIAEELVHRMVKRAVAMEGTVTGEHGVGLVKRDYLPHELGEST
ncbi:hypothetical protein VE04_06255 [Pseudogymnoascus sp. 24MN13]|nr:hypothetical protein VE04_06255 [Pseudogymnoascus sp. 24MN13]